jgi:leucyl-tRNA synthetase
MAFGNWKLEIGNSAFSRLARKWCPVDMYIGGAEHAVLHLLYVRFVAMVLHDLKLAHFDEPVKRFRAHGLLIREGAKMSKSRGNVVNPDEYIRKFGADALRTYLMFLAPFEHGGDFRDQGIFGVERFLNRVWRLANAKLEVKSEKQTGKNLDRTLHRTIKKVTEDIETLDYNTAVSALMICLNEFEKGGQPNREQFGTFLKLLAPFAPHMAEELWQKLRGSVEIISADQRGSNPHKSAFHSIHCEPWPKYDPKLLVADTFTLVIQINGKARDSVEVPAGLGEAEARRLALGREKVKHYVGNAAPRKVIYVPNRLVNIVT